MSFFTRLADRVSRTDSVLSVGLDPAPGRLPDAVAGAELPRWAFNRRIIDATHNHAACFKPNAAFYEDSDGWRALEETVAYAHGKDVPVVLDAKRADIGSTARQYATVLETVDAVTVNPYLGRDSVDPFLQAPGGVFLLCRSSNDGAADLQTLELATGEPVYERVAALASDWGEDVGLVVGATAPAELEAVRAAAPELPFLVPGVGAQNGDPEAAVKHGLVDGVGLINSSRKVIFAGETARTRTSDEYFTAAGAAAKQLKRRLNRYR
ncbi:MAG: orotidine 5''-phosphate decarboxylase, subfamily 2 [halophilic archaeon J07HX5]|nr:MAG: orotidine 5''-phosphate decarboxylase, subfamily 2 [halophilic archaeon J07HX5]